MKTGSRPSAHSLLAFCVGSRGPLQVCRKETYTCLQIWSCYCLLSAYLSHHSLQGGLLIILKVNLISVKQPATQTYIWLLSLVSMLLLVCWTSWICKPISFIKLGKCLVIISLNVFLLHFLSWIPVEYVRSPILSRTPCSSDLQSFYFLFFILDTFWWSVFRFPDTFFCPLWSVVKPPVNEDKLRPALTSREVNTTVWP